MSVSRLSRARTVAVVGHTGAGKTTLTSLLLRFYDVQRGEIRIGGVNIRDFELDALRRHFGVVLQDPYLFTGTSGAISGWAPKASAIRRWRKPRNA